MEFQTPLICATLTRRYKRFLADAILDDGRQVTAHCPNPGAMDGLKDPGQTIWLEPVNDPRKKLKFGWRLAELNRGNLVGIDTSLPNRLVKEALQERRISTLAKYDVIRAEVPYGKNSRIDFHLSGGGHETFVEVKNLHFNRDGDLAEFPDSVTARGTKHLHELTEVVGAGHRAVMLYLVQRMDCARFKIAADRDPDYAHAFDMARAAGVEMICYDCHITLEGISLGKPLGVDAALQALAL